MQKINLNSINIMIDKCTGSEIDLALYLGSLQNDFGSVRNIYYKDVCLTLNISKTTFYSSLNNLEKLGIINIDWTNSRLWNITFCNNIFYNEKDYKAGYLNINMDFLHTKEFKKAKLNVKKLVLKLLVLTKQNKTFRISLHKLINDWIKVSNVTLFDSYIKELEQWFDVKVKGEVYYFSLKDSSLKAANSDLETFLSHKIKAFCNTYRVNYTLKDLKDLIILFKQYGGKKLNKLIHTLCDTIDRYRTIEPALINSIINKL